MTDIARAGTPDQIEMLKQELASCRLSRVTPDATSEELIRDMHQVLAGNGGTTYGLIFKMAAANVNIRDLAGRVDELSGRLNQQIKRCDDVQATNRLKAAAREGERLTISRIGAALWDNRQWLFVVLVVAIGYVMTTVGRERDMSKLDQRLNRLVEERIAGIQK